MLEVRKFCNKKFYIFYSPGTLPPGITNSEIFLVFSTMELTTVIPSVICRQFPNLLFLLFIHSGITNLTSHALQHCTNLNAFGVHISQMVNLPGNLFINNPSLGVVSFIGNRLESIPSDLIRNLRFLEIFTISANYIHNLPDGLFTHPNILTIIDVSANNLTTIDSKVFGNSSQNLQRVRASWNQISSIDRAWFDSVTRLDRLILEENLCINENFFDFHNNRDSVRRELQFCFDNFENPFAEYIRCSYVDTRCDMTINNPTGRDDFVSIDGE